MSYEDEWELGSGLTLDGAVATVTGAEFGFNANMGAGITCLNLKLETADHGEEVEQSFSCGGNFEASRDGSTLEGSGRINRGSNYGILLESVKEVLGDAGLNPGDVLGNPREAQSWVGTTWMWGTVERETTNPKTGQTKVSSKFIVTAFEGGAGGNAGNAKTAKASAGATSAGVKGNAKIDSEKWDYLVNIASQFNDYNEFVVAVMSDEDVRGSKDIQKAVMSSGDGSIWAAAHEG